MASEVAIAEPHSENTPLLAQCNGSIPSHETPSSQIFREELINLAGDAFCAWITVICDFTLLSAPLVALGHLSVLHYSAAALGALTASVTGYSIFQGFASGLESLLPPAWTSKTPHMVGVWTQRATLLTSILLIPTFTIWFNAESILLFLRQDPELARLAGVYLKWSLLGLPAYAFDCIARRYFYAQRKFTAPMVVVMVVAPTNAFFCWLFVHRLGLGFVGAPLATSLTFNLLFFSLVLYGYFFLPRTAWAPIGRTALEEWPRVVRLGAGGIGEIAPVWWVWELMGLAASAFGKVPLAAQSALLTSSAGMYQAIFALSIATTPRVGNLLGEGKARRASLVAYSGVLLVVAISSVQCSLMYIFRENWALIFTYDPGVSAIVASTLPILALFQIFDGLAEISCGILRVRGLQTTGAALALVSYYGFGLPLGLMLAFKAGLKIAGLWIGVTIALVFLAAIGLWVGIVSVDWKVEVEKAAQRVGGEGRTAP